jgi:N-acetylglutamate synthase-like GNAT family acetyltransferase
MPITIRRATSDDQKTISRLVRSANINPLSLHWQRFLVAEDGSRIVGVGQIKLHGDGSRELASIATVPEHRGKGIATEIIKALLAGQTADIYLTCRSPMVGFYERFGFQCVTALADMPPYFRRLMRLGNVLFAVARRLGRELGGAVMVRKGT